MKDNKAAVARLLFKLGAIKFSTNPDEFKLKLHETQPDAPKSPIYLMLRTDEHPTNPGPLTRETMSYIGHLMLDQISEESIAFDCYVGIPEAGEPFADAIGWIVSWWKDPPKRLKLQKENLGDGKRRISSKVTGDFKRGYRVLLIDDLITQADSKLEAIAALETNGLVVVHVLVLVDRMQGGKEQLEAKGYKLVAVFTLGEMLELYVLEKLVPSIKADETLKYLEDNRVVLQP